MVHVPLFISHDQSTYWDTLLLTYLVESLSGQVDQSICPNCPKYETRWCVTSMYKQTEATSKWCGLFVHLCICLCPSISYPKSETTGSDWQWLAWHGLKLSCTRRRYIDRSHHLSDQHIDRRWTKPSRTPLPGTPNNSKIPSLPKDALLGTCLEVAE